MKTGEALASLFFLFPYPPKEPIRYGVFPYQASRHRPVAFPIPSCIHIPFKGLEERLLWECLIDKADMAYPSQGSVVHREHICFPNSPTLNSPVRFRPGHSHSVCPLVRKATLLPQVYHRVATPSLPRDSSCVAYNGINTRPTIVYGAFPCANKFLCLFLYAAVYLSEQRAAMSKCKA